MYTYIEKWLKKAAIAALSFVIFSITIMPANAFTLIENIAEKLEIVSSSVTTSFSPEKGETATINYCISAPAQVTLGIYAAIGRSSSEKVNILRDGESKLKGCYSVSWDGKYGNKNEVGTYGETAPAGQYFYGLSVAPIIDMSYDSDYVGEWFELTSKDTKTGSGVKITDIEVENGTFDPWDDQEAKVTFSINKASYITFEIKDEDGEKIATPVKKDWYDSGEYSINWDGRDEVGDFVSQGQYSFTLKAELDGDKDSEKGQFSVKKGYDLDDDNTIDPRLKTVYATKDTFDPGRNEKTSIVFNLTAKADVQVKIYDKNDKKVADLMDDEDKQPGIYTVEWDGEESLNEKATYTYKVFAKNSKGEDLKSGKIKVEEDEKGTNKPNIYKDSVDQIPFTPKFNTLGISFKLEKDAEVTVEIRNSKHTVAKIIDDTELTEGPHTIIWDGTDKYGEVAEDGLYEYKIVASTKKGKDTETGNFSIEDSTKAKIQGEMCAGFADLKVDYSYCEAIEWAVGEGIFEGYNDGNFKPSQAINRVEALKVIFKALHVNLLDSHGESLGFTDTDRYEWYATYLKTAVSLGVINGYPDGTFKPGQDVKRAEALVMFLNTAKAKDGIIIPSNNYAQPYYDTPNNKDTKWYISYAWFAKSYSLTDNDYYFYPAEKMTRGEMADMLYRYHKANIQE